MARLNRMPTVLKRSPELTLEPDSTEDPLSISHQLAGTPLGQLCQQPCSWNSLAGTFSHNYKQMKKSWEEGKKQSSDYSSLF